MTRIDRSDVAVVLGAACTGCGCYMVAPALALIVVGCLIMGWGVAVGSRAPSE